MLRAFAWQFIVLAFPIASGLAAENDFQTRFSQFENYLLDQRQGRVARLNVEEVRDRINQLFDGIDISQLDINDLESIASNATLTRMMPDSVRHEVDSRLDKLKLDRGPDGARADMLALHTQLNADMQTAISGNLPASREGKEALLEAQRDAVRRVMNHPGFSDSVRQGSASLFFESMGHLMFGNNRPLMVKELLQLELLLDEKLSPQTTIVLGDTVRSFQGPVKGQQVLTPTDFNRLRSKLLTALASIDSSSLEDRDQRDFEGLHSFLATGFGKAAELVGQPAPDLEFLWSSNDQNIRRLDELKGKIVVIDFWAVWCVGCVKKFPELQRLQEKYQDAPVVILGVTTLQNAMLDEAGEVVDTSDNPELEYQLMQRYIDSKQITWPVAFMNGDLFDNPYAVSAIPHYTILAPDGTVRLNSTPGSFEQGKFEETIDQLLQELDSKRR